MSGPREPNGSILVRFSGAAGQSETTQLMLAAGDLIGRHACCALRMDHPSSPLVAAAVVRRGRRMFLEGQHDRLVVSGRRSRRVRLRAGIRIDIPTASLFIDEVMRPAQSMAVAIGDHLPQELVAPFYSLRGGPKPDLLPGEIESPDALIVDSADGWRIAVGQGPTDPLLPGRIWQIAGTTLRTSTVWLDQPPLQEPGEPLQLEFDAGGSVRIRRATRHRVTLRGGPAKLLHTLQRAGGVTAPADLEHATGSTVAEVLDDMSDLLRAHGLRSNLVRPDGLGGIELFLNSFDRVVKLRHAETG